MARPRNAFPSSVPTSGRFGGKRFAKEDESTGEPLIDSIVDQAEQKGTGTWTAVDISGEGQGVRTYALTLQSKYQSTMASMITIRAQAARLLAFAA